MAHPRRAPAALLLLLLALVAAGCSTAASGPTSTTSTGLPSSSTTTTPGTTTPGTTVPTSTTQPSGSIGASATDAAVIAAYRAAAAAFEHAGLTANPLDPALKATMVDPLLHQIEGYLVEDNLEGEVAQGTVELHPHVASVTATRAVIEDCALSKDYLIYKSSGKQVPPVTGPEHDGIRAVLVLDGSTWKMSQQTITEGSCPAGY